MENKDRSKKKQITQILSYTQNPNNFKTKRSIDPPKTNTYQREIRTQRSTRLLPPRPSS